MQKEPRIVKREGSVVMLVFVLDNKKALIAKTAVREGVFQNPNFSLDFFPAVLRRLRPDGRPIFGIFTVHQRMLPEFHTRSRQELLKSVN